MIFRYTPNTITEKNVIIKYVKAAWIVTYERIQNSNFWFHMEFVIFKYVKLCASW